MRAILKQAAVQLATAQELATLLGGDPSTYKKRAQQGRAEAVKKGNTWLFDPEDFSLPPQTRDDAVPTAQGLST